MFSAASSSASIVGLLLAVCVGHAAAFGAMVPPSIQHMALSHNIALRPHQFSQAQASSRACTAKLTSLGSSGGGGISGGGRGGGGGGGGGGDDSDLPADVVKLLAGRKLPEDIAVAAAAGRIGVSEVAAWLQVQDSALLSAIAKFSGAMKSRLVADPRFFPTLAIELVVGCVTKMLAEVIERNKRNAFWKEIDFVASDMALEVLGDFGLVFFLAPTAAIAAPATSGIAKTLQGLPGFFLQKGAFTPSQRAACYVYKAAIFWCIGFLTSAVGHSTTKLLIEMRGQPTEHMASVMDNSVQWGNFLGVSSNLRYQLISSYEANLLPVLFKGSLGKTVGSTAVRLANCYSGGVQWLLWKRIIGIE